MPTARRGDRTLHYELSGAGPPLVLVPGLGGGRKLFGTLPRRFARDGRTCLTFDPVGIPPSSPHAGAFRLDEAARDLVAVFDAAGIERCDVVATSLGGKVALELTAIVPDRVGRLVLLASAATASARARWVYRYFEHLASHLPPTELGEAVAPFLFGEGFHERHPEVVADIVRAMRPDGAARELMVAQARALQDWSGEELARGVRCPTLCIGGIEDTLTSIAEVRRTAELIGGAKLEAVKAGHSLLLESAEVYELVRGFS